MLIQKRYSLPYVQCPDIGQWRCQRSTPIDTTKGMTFDLLLTLVPDIAGV